ncbi:MAG TPA: glycosyltransferase family 4 protein [Candidatus Acidoferrales bacterium]|nr:glycosyltransferase family 4 protein [Candidatus Acidoferrales bacterium]
MRKCQKRAAARDAALYRRTSCECPKTASEMESFCVLFLQGSTGFGGSKVSLLDTLRALKGTRYQPVVACPEEGWLTRQLQSCAIPYVLLPFYAWRKWLERPWVKLSIRRQWLPALKPWRFSIVHSNEFWWAPHAVELAKQLKISSVAHLRDGHHTLRKARQYQLQQLSCVISVSTELCEEFRDVPELYQKNQVLFNGHEPKTFAGSQQEARRRLGLWPEGFVVGNAGRLCDRKNQRLLLRVMARLKYSNRLPRFSLIFAGDADPSYASLMNRDIQELGLRREVKILGVLDDMGAFFSAIDLFVHCARREGLARVIPEAMLAKRAVVATAAQGVKDAIPDSTFGSVVDIDDESALENEIHALYQAPNRRRLMAERAYQRAQNLFSSEAYRAQLTALYEKLLALAKLARQGDLEA